MGLGKYVQKRKFNETTEPKGEKRSSGKSLIFVVQKHHATQLHYDFRLEMEGVLKSWAVPKGPSMNPEDRRLAMMVEDHPYDYKDFEGNIPKGNYGAGNVIVWDTGEYLPEDESGKKGAENTLLAELKKGHLNIILKGKKLKGVFSLVKMKNKQDNAWLLIKKKDQYASTADILKMNKSVLSNKTIEKMDEVSGRKSKTGNKDEPEPAAAKRTTQKPGKVKPMLAEIADAPFDDEDWIFEKKFDGYRALALCNGKADVQLYSRNLNSFNSRYKPIADELSKISHPYLIDGEIVVEDNTGRSQFQLLQNYQRDKKGDLKYYVFDLLSLDGNDLTSLPLLKREELLALLLKKIRLQNVIYSEHIVEKGISFYKQAVKDKLEGIMAKRADSLYSIDSRSGDWLKIKITHQQEAIIAGITEAQGSRKFFGSIILGVYQNNELTYIGHCGTGFDFDTLKKLHQKFSPLFVSKSPFAKAVKVNAKVQWLKPKLVCEVKFSEWTGEGLMRHPVYLGLREDKTAKEVVKEISKSMKTEKSTKPKGRTTSEQAEDENKEAKSSNDFERKVGKVSLKFTNQNKIYWPDDKIIKGQLIEYYDKISGFILPYLKDRPQSMHRFPNGINKPAFYQKDVNPESIPSWIRTEKIYSESNKADINYLICDDKATLLYMANLGCIELNPWNSRIKKIENPDWLVLDLDPEDIPFKEVVKTALNIKKLFDKLEIDCYCKTSGATGLHIFVPLAAKYDYEVARNFANVIAKQINEQLPDTTSILRIPKQRKHKIYLDFLQNSRGQTLAAPYSVRPRPGATVSTPLAWNEVNEKLDVHNFTIHSILKRLDKTGDLWQPVIGAGANLQKAMKLLSA